ncbi:HIT domain-containing protein [Cladophialophora immunda]|nr:HIT domain-containing protein [Cladophialophora immunda]
MSDVPRLIHESRSHPSSQSDRDFSSSCPFCAIGSTYSTTSPLSSSETMAKALDPEQLDPPSFVLYSSEHVIAFLDIMPLTRGHVLVAPRKHRVKVGDLSPSEGAEIGRVLPLLARSVIKAVLPDIPHQDADYNVVQNNGPGAAQVVPHVHFHIVPRPPLNYNHPQASTPTSSARKYAPNRQPSGRQAAAILFGRGMREDLDYDDAAVLVEDMRAAIREEWEKSFGREEGRATAETVTGTRSSVVAGSQAGGDGGDGNGRRLAWKV